MQDFISEIYRFANIIPGIQSVISYCYCCDSDKVKSEWSAIAPVLTDFCKNLFQYDQALANEIMNICEKGCKSTSGSIVNYNLMGDALAGVLPLIKSGIKYFSSIDVSENDYRLFSSASGFLSLENTVTGHFYHSVDNPIGEARIRARNLYFPTQQAFHFVGCGLGYLPYELYRLSDESLDIYIYHINPNIIQYAMDYGFLSLIPESKLHICYFNDTDELISMLSKIDFDSIFDGFVYLQDATDLLESEIVPKLASIAIASNTRSDFNLSCDINLWHNVRNCSYSVFELKKELEPSEWIVVVAGPSLDDNIEYVKSNIGTKKIICASTVYKKLLDNDIIPDFVCVCDPQARTYKHFDGVNEYSPVLLVESSANWRFAANYPGAKVLVPSSANLSALEHFKADGVTPFFITGSVSYMCVLMAQLLNATAIHLVGMDLAYPNGQSHASGTMDNHSVSSDNMPLVPSVSGGMVPTTQQFIYYINSMNDLFNSIDSIPIINHSDIGAAFENTIWHKNI